MISFLVSLLALFLGYQIYGRIAERVFSPDNRETPALQKADGVDYVLLPSWRIFMIQFLNIAGTGPIFGAIMGMWFGPVSYIWIVLGCIFGGAVHDYMSGMLSLRNDGCGLPELTGRYLGKTARKILIVFTIFVLLLVGAYFVFSPAIILGSLWGSELMWVIIIFAYYIVATMLPIDKIIGKIYPLFAISMLFMVVALCVVMVMKWPSLPEVWDGVHNWGAERLGLKQTIFPCLFVTIACGAVSGFHATQSPLMARCMKSEKQGRSIFYGAMITEGVVALVWAAVSSYFFFEGGWKEVCSPELVAQFTGQSEKSLIQFFAAPTVVTEICHGWLGAVGSILALLGVVAAPISTGDTALRSARLIIAEAVKLKQRSIVNRLYICIPLFIAAALFLVWQMSNPNGFQTVWQYVGWGTQMLAVVSLWNATVYLVEEKKCYWITLLPAVFMTVIVSDFLLLSPSMIGLPAVWAHSLTALITLLVIVRFVVWRRRFLKKFGGDD